MITSIEADFLLMLFFHLIFVRFWKVFKLPLIGWKKASIKATPIEVMQTYYSIFVQTVSFRRNYNFLTYIYIFQNRLYKDILFLAFWDWLSNYQCHYYILDWKTKQKTLLLKTLAIRVYWLFLLPPSQDMIWTRANCYFVNKLLTRLAACIPFK